MHILKNQVSPWSHTTAYDQLAHGCRVFKKLRRTRTFNFLSELCQLSYKFLKFKNYVIVGIAFEKTTSTIFFILLKGGNSKTFSRERIISSPIFKFDFSG